MSYPYVLDLSFGSEKAVADPISHVAVSATGPSLPTTRAELETLISEGRAYGSLEVNGKTMEVEGISEEVTATFPSNLLGVVTDDGTSDPEPVEFMLSVDGSTLSITRWIGEGVNVAIILNHPID